MKKVARKVMWVGRATVFTVGLTVTLALMIGAATTALASVPGDPFKLGQVNAVDAASTLVGRVNGAMLSVQNQSPGSKGAASPAVSLKVAPGNPPLVANPEAGTATGLSADELDGLDQSAFLRASGKAVNADLLDGTDLSGLASGINGKAIDADKLDGKDSTQFLAANGKASDSDRLDGLNSSSFWTGEIYNLGSSPVTGTPFAKTSSGAGPCDPGDAAINGNYQFLGDTGDHEIHFDQIFHDNSYTVAWSNGPVADTLVANVTCADFPPLR